MKFSCPHCSQRLDLDAETLDSLHEASGFECPACGGQVPLDRTMPDSGKGSSATGWMAPDAEELSRSFDSRYQIIRLLGRGGMGAVYEGLDTRLDRRVAIKILPMETGRNMDALARFDREAKAMAALDHPNIVHIHDYGNTTDGHPYFVMEFIDGMDLHGLRHSGNLDLPGALEIISQVCSALHYAHGRGIIHRDIKPANIMVTREGVAKVADFGLAKVLGTEAHPRYDPTLTVSGAAMGTPDYMAPEQLEGQPVDHRADIYSLGVMLYALLTGSPPRGAWPPPSQRVQIDIRLDEIVLRALQLNPSARYQAASEVRADIDSVKSSTGGGPLPPGVDPEPLPSSRVADPSAHRTTSAPSQPTGKTKPARTLHPVAKAPDSAHSLSNTMLVLGLLAIAMLGGLAIYLANRKTGDTYISETSTTTSEENNTTITRHIPPGLTPKDVEGIGNILPYDSGYIGISMEALDWGKAQELAKHAGAEVLFVDESAAAWKPMHEWLQTSFPAAMTTKAWVRAKDEPRIVDSQRVTVPDSPQNPSPELRHKVLLHWRGGKYSSSAVTDKPTAAAGDWIDLQDVSRWKGSKDAGFPDGAWGIEGGALRNFHGANHQDLETREKFRNFELEFEWKFSTGGNSGIFYGQREFQLVDDANNPNGKLPVTSCGALCNFIPPNAKKRIEPAGEYNRGKLVVSGNQVEHWINGEKIVDYKLGSPELESIVESGQFKNLPGYKKIDTTAGDTAISLQSHGGNVWFRNIRIRKLDGSQADTQNIRNEIINNSYFQNLISTGVTTMKDLDAIAMIRPYDDGFIGISTEPMTWAQANDLAKRTGSDIQASATAVSSKAAELAQSIARLFPQETATPLWMSKGGAPAVLAGGEVLTVKGSDESRQVALRWHLDGRSQRAKAYANRGFSIGGFDASRGGEFSLSEGDKISAFRESVLKDYPDVSFLGATELTKSFLDSLDQVLLISTTEGVSGGTISPLTESEQMALLDFVMTGGSAILMVDCIKEEKGRINHNSLIAPFGMRVNGNAEGAQQAIASANDPNPITNGPHGTVKALMGSWVGYFEELGKATILANWKTGPGLAYLPPGVLGNGSGPVVLISENTLISHRFTHADNSALLRNSVALAASIRSKRLSGLSWVDPLIPKEYPAKKDGMEASPRTSPMTSSRTGEPIPAGPLPWTNTDGKTIQAEFVRLNGDSVVIRKDGKEFSILISKLTPASSAQAKAMGRKTIDVLLHYDFSDAAGTIVKDRSGNGRDGTLVGFANTKSGAGNTGAASSGWTKDGSLVFDGLNDSVVTPLMLEDLVGGEGFTIEAVAGHRNVGSSHSIIVGTDSASLSVSSGVIQVGKGLNESQDIPSSALFARLNGLSQAVFQSKQPTSLGDGNLHHVALVYDAALGRVSLYFEHQLHARWDQLEGSPSAGTRIVLGKVYWSKVENWLGPISEVRIAKGPLAPSQFLPTP